MSGASSHPLLGPSPSDRAPRRAALLVLSALALLVLLVVASYAWTGAVAATREVGAGTPLRVAVSPPADFWLTNFSANNTTVDVSMAFNVSVEVNLTGVIQNNTANNTDSNFTFAWSGLPAFVPGEPGSGCAGFAGVADNNSSVLNCTAATDKPLSISVVVTNFTNGESNTTTALAITVNPLPSITAFTVNTADSVKIAVNTSVTFTVTASGGTGGLAYQYTGLPLGCSSSAASFSCTPDRVGVYNVTVVAVDSYGFTSTLWNVTVTVEAPAKHTTSGIGTTGWAVVIGIVVIGFLATAALLLQARREERAGEMATEEPSPGSGDMGSSPPPPPGPSS